jgi:hypothetical protein
MIINDLSYLYYIGSVCVWVGLWCCVGCVMEFRNVCMGVRMWFYGGVLCIVWLCQMTYCYDCFCQFFVHLLVYYCVCIDNVEILFYAFPQVPRPKN